MNKSLNSEIQLNQWHNIPLSDVTGSLSVDATSGLNEEEATERLTTFGDNKLSDKPPRSKISLFLDQFKSVLIIILIGAALLAGAIGDTKDAIVILFVVVLNALLGFWQENRAEATLAALKKMLSPVARVRRNNLVKEISATQLVPGDIVLLEAGDRVPCDGRLLVAHNLEIDEAALTGESLPVGKQIDITVSKGATPAERVNMAFMNTVITRGRAELVVTATGMNTEMGRLSGLLADADEGQTPLQIQLDVLGRRLAVLAGLVVAVIFSLGLIRGEPFVQTVLTSIALAVAAIPEGLPAVVTVTLAIGMHRMSQQRAIVKKLAAVETLGCTTVICSDKTGTLTMNQMTAREIVCGSSRFQVSGEGYSEQGSIEAIEGNQTDLTDLFNASTLANDSRIRGGQLIGDPTEGALLAMAAKGGVDHEQLLDHFPRIAEVPFDSAHKFQATFHHDGDVVQVYVKGAPDVLIARSASYRDRDSSVAFTDESKELWLQHNERLASQAMRVLGLAKKTINAKDFDPATHLQPHTESLEFIGLVGMIDPPRPEAAEAIKLCHKAGINVKMITGDHRHTAAAIAKELNLKGQVLEGAEIDKLNQSELEARVKDVDVFARVAPEHKVRIVRSLKAIGEVTAMTGDGVNDAPALKHADIGVAMGVTGTEVTKEAATMILTDDNFATIVQAVKEGRGIYDNIVKFVRFQLSTNIGAIQTVLGATLMGWASPFTAIQILWINIIMDGPPAMSLGVEPPRKRLMKEPPRQPGDRILTLVRLGIMFIYGSIMAIGTLSMFWYGQTKGDIYAMTLAFTTFVLFQFFNLFNARMEFASIINSHFLRNRWLWLSLAAVLVLQVLVVHWQPAQSIFKTTDLALNDWGLAIIVSASILLFDEVRKFFLRRLRS